MRRTKKLSIEELAPFLLPDVPRGTLAPPIVWDNLFGNDNPVEIEIGFGKGLYLTTAGCAWPDTNFLGIEIVRKYQYYAATRMTLRGLTNVRVACADGRVVLRDQVAPKSVDAVHVYFPDPWWKARHRKRRVFTPEFAYRRHRTSSRRSLADRHRRRSVLRHHDADRPRTGTCIPRVAAASGQRTAARHGLPDKLQA